MSDLISRQAAIDAIERNSCNTQRAIDAVNALPSAQPEQRWIPCSERLPEEYGNYLISISIDGGEPDIGTINPNDPRGWSLCDANGFYWVASKGLEVIAWMPLPEPYREGRWEE